ncbi:MAG: VC0807 family protein [Akkermansiaceae bacterium]
MADQIKPKKKPDNSLLDIVVNVIAPVMILSYMSKEEGKFWHLGPVTAMAIALILPLAFGIWHFIKHKKLNLFSCVGLFAILLTGLITIYLFYNEASRPHVGIIFGIKEAIQPLVIGSLFLITHKMTSPLLNTFLYNDALFDVKRIEKSVKTNEKQPDYKALLWKCSLIMFGSFCVSAVANMALSLYFFKGLSPTIENWKVEYNEIVGKITGWGFLVIGAPFFFVMAFILYFMLNGLKKLTGLDTEEILVGR